VCFARPRDDGSVLAADLLVGADGIHSTVRRLVFGAEDQFLRFLGFHTCAYTFEAPRIHAEVNGRFCLTAIIGRQIGFYGLRDGRGATFAVHRTPDLAVPADLPGAIRDAYGSLRWIVPEALAACPPRQYDQVAQVVLPRCSKGRSCWSGMRRMPSHCSRARAAELSATMPANRRRR
jgi:2-polyprenyl-6-methoxyphenol hydroxylase-like FAD-dependent oxidoreductase